MNIPEGATHQGEDNSILKDYGDLIYIYENCEWQEVSSWAMLGAVKLTEIKQVNYD